MPTGRDYSPLHRRAEEQRPHGPLRVLAVVAHADDEVLGCGGTLAKHADAGDLVTVLCLCACDRELELRRACGALGAALEIGPIPAEDDQRFDKYDFLDLVSAVEYVAFPLLIDVCYLHNLSDLNLDHELAGRATLTALRPNIRHAPTMLAFETPSSTEWSPAAFEPNWFVELEVGDMGRKVRALNEYRSQLRKPPNPRNKAGVFTHAGARGAQAGAHLAEAFRLIRHVD